MKNAQVMLVPCINYHTVHNLYIPIQESFLLWGSQNWIKAVVKGDSLLFIYRCQQVSNYMILNYFTFTHF